MSVTSGGPQYDTQNDKRRAENSRVCCTRGQKGFRCYGSTVKYTLVINNRYIMGCNWRQVGSCLRLMDDKRRKNKNNNATVPKLGVRLDYCFECVTFSIHDGFQYSYVLVLPLRVCGMRDVSPDFSGLVVYCVLHVLAYVSCFCIIRVALLGRGAQRRWPSTQRSR